MSTRPRAARGGWVTDYGLARYDRKLARWHKCHDRSPQWVPVPDGHEYHRRQLARRGRNR